MKYFFFILALFVSNFLFGQGLIMPDNGFDVCRIFIPRSGLDIYEKPDGISIGKLTLGKPDSNNEIYSAYIKIGDNLNEFAYPNFHMVGYEIMAMIFQESQPAAQSLPTSRKIKS